MNKLSIIWGCIFIFLIKLQIFSNDQIWLSQVPESDVKNTIVYQAFSYDGNRHYETTVYGNDLMGIVKWRKGDEAPISVLKIRTIAENAFQKSFTESSSFKLYSISFIYLAIVDDWIAQVQFNEVNPSESSPEEKQINIIVLLNGRVIFPKEK